MLSFSTCWNSYRHTDGESLVREILNMGFDTIEISHGLNISLLPGIMKMFDDGLIKVSGVHNFCPSPIEVMIDAPDAYEFTSHRVFERERALSLSVKTIETAARFGGTYVVLHMGTVPVKHFTPELEEMVAAGKINTRAYAARKLKAVQDREKLAPLYVRRANETLTTLSEHAKKHNVALGVESRSHYEQLPTEREMVQLMDDFADDPHVGYWHDFGHVQRKANLSLLDHHQWLERMQPHLVGCHLHDVLWPARDHRVPFQGSIDYDGLMPHIAPHKPIVWELSPSRKKRDIIPALERWRERYPDTQSTTA